MLYWCRPRLRQPGPRVGELLEAIREAQAVGKVCSPEDALALARRLLRDEGGATG